MSIGTDTIEMAIGEDVVLPFQMDPEANITGWTIELNVRGAAGVVLNKSATIPTPLTGAYEFAIVDTDTDELRPGVYLYDVWRTDSGNERRLAQGSFKLVAGARAVS